MPIYEYQCGHCGHLFEAFQHVKDAALVTCPSCDRDELKKLVSAAGFQLKGDGWYITDYKNKDKKPTTDKPATTTTETKTDSKTTSDQSASGEGTKK